MNILLIGCEGKMGKCMQQLLKQENINYYGIDKNNRDLPDDIKVNIILDFSLSEALKDNLKLAKKLKCPIVIASTAHSQENYHLIEIYKKHIPIFIASNFSLGFNVMLMMLNNLKLLSKWEYVIEETHHKYKKDSPSGSCKQILEKLNSFNINPSMACFRVGNVVGEHSLTMYDDYEYIKIEHKALDKKVFCKGALNICKFMNNKEVGLYTMEDFLSDNSL